MPSRLGEVKEQVVPVLHVEDASRAVAWYERLGFRKEWEHQFEPGFPWFVSVARGNVRVYLSEHEGDARPETLIHLYVEDIEAVAAELSVPVDEEGLAGRECDVSDPDGNRLRIATPRTRAADPHELVSSFWARIQARDWDGLGDLLADDFYVEWPDTRLRIRGRENFVEFNRTYPEGWTIEVQEIVAQGETVVSEVRVPHIEQGTYYVISIFTVDSDRLMRGREYWLEDHVEEQPAERARFFEPM